MTRLDHRAYKVGESSLLVDQHGKAFKYTQEDVNTLFKLVGRAAFFRMLNRKGRDIYRDTQCSIERKRVRSTNYAVEDQKRVFDDLRRRQMVEAFIVSRSGEHEP
jgi:hypothetical protein